QKGEPEIIPGFVRCFHCFKTLQYNGSTKYMIKHQCSNANSSGIENHSVQQTIDKFVGKQIIVHKHDREKLKEKIVCWSCSSIRPFTVVEDSGFINIMKEAIILGSKYGGDLNIESVIPTAKTVANNVRHLAEDYRRKLKSTLICQAEARCLNIIPDLWSDKHRKISYIGLTCAFVNTSCQLIVIDLCCGEYDDMDKTGRSVFLDLVHLLETFQDVFKLIQTGDRPTLHMVYVGMNKLKLHLDGKDIDTNGDLILIDDRHEDNFVLKLCSHEFCFLGIDFYRQRIKQLLFLMFHFDKKHLAAALLHPQYRKLSFIDDYKRSETHIYVQQLITELRDCQSGQQQMESIAASSEPLKKKHKTIEEQFIDPEDADNDTFSSDSTSTRNQVDELNIYLKMSIDDKFKAPNPLPFWHHYQNKLPCLAKLARRLYSIPATSADVERQFSAVGVLVNERRASLNPDTVEDVLFVRSIQKALMKNPNLLSDNC
ncbi:unnamed protein product, partial [Rotaria sp. Silwood2]